MIVLRYLVLISCSFPLVARAEPAGEAPLLDGREVLADDRLVVFCPSFEVGEDGWRSCSEPLFFSCREQQLFFLAEKPVRIRLDDGNLEVEGDGTLVLLREGTDALRPLTVTNLRMPARDLRPSFVDVAVLRRVEQKADDERLADIDARRVLDYAFEEARFGNILPMARMSAGGESAASLDNPQVRSEVANRFNMKDEDVAALSNEELLIELARRDFRKMHWHVGCELKPPTDDRVGYSSRRVGGVSGGTLVKRDGRWMLP